jgi:hypothetical protein
MQAPESILTSPPGSARASAPSRHSAQMA